MLSFIRVNNRHGKRTTRQKKKTNAKQKSGESKVGTAVRTHSLRRRRCRAIALNDALDVFPRHRKTSGMPGGGRSTSSKLALYRHTLSHYHIEYRKITHRGPSTKEKSPSRQCYDFQREATSNLFYGGERRKSNNRRQTQKEHKFSHALQSFCRLKPIIL